jgi:spermidine synthase
VLLFLLSGATSLVYESIWARQLHLIVGTSQLAIAIVLAAFMAGLALGGLLAARYASRVARPLIAFAALEGFVAVYALGFGFLLDPATRLYLSLGAAVSADSAALVLAQFVVLGALLLPPTICMGATLPLLARFAASGGTEGAGTQVGRLYGANTIGAVVGTFLAGFLLLPQLGMAATTWCAAGGNLFVALAALALATRSDVLPAVPASEVHARSDPESPRVAPLLLISALAGFASLLCEVAWFRLMTLILGGSTYSFSIMLLAFLLGIGLGGWGGGWLADRVFGRVGRFGVLRGLALMQLGVAITSWAAMFAYGELPYQFVLLFDKVQGSATALFSMKLAIALGIMLIPALLMGATFPYLVRLLVREDGQISRPVGQVYSANTAGAIVGASLGGLLLLPALGMAGSVLAAASVNFIAAGIAMSIAAPPHLVARRTVAFAAASLSCVGFIHWQKPPWNPLLMSAGMYQYASRLPELSRQALHDFSVEPFDLLFYEEGPSSVVTVAKNRSTGHIWLANNGKVDASSRGDMNTQVLVAHVAGLMGHHPEKALMIGLASGVSAGSLLLDERIQSLEIAEIEPAGVPASHFFDHINNRPLDDPRVRVRLNDARNHLMRAADSSYDLVVSEPSNPWISGVSNLFTREFFALGRRKLTAEGVWVQWVNVYNTAAIDMRSLLATFADVYPNVEVFRVGYSDLVLVGSLLPLRLSADTVDEYVASSQAIVDDLNRVGLKSAEEILSLYQFGRGRLVDFAGDVELNTDDNMRIEYSTPLTLHAETSERNIELLEQVAEIPYHAVRQTRLGRLAFSYAMRDRGWRRALGTINHATMLEPDDLELAGLKTRLTEAHRKNKQRFPHLR